MSELQRGHEHRLHQISVSKTDEQKKDEDKVDKTQRLYHTTEREINTIHTVQREERH